MSQRKLITLSIAIASMLLLAAETTQSRAEQRVNRRITTATQESQKFQSILSARIAAGRAQAEPTQAPRAPRLPFQIRLWAAELPLPSGLLGSDDGLEQLQRRLPSRWIATLGLPTTLLAPRRMGRRLDDRRRPQEPE